MERWRGGGLLRLARRGRTSGRDGFYCAERGGEKE